MATFSGLASFLWPRADRRSAREIEDDIRDELRFHVDEATDALVASGLEPAQARERALAKFGDIERVRGACRRVQLGDRIMLQRIQWVVIAVLVCAVIALGFQLVREQQLALAQRDLAQAQVHEAEVLRATIGAMSKESVGLQSAGVNQAAVVSGTDGRIDVSLAPQANLQATIDGWLVRLMADPSNWREAIAVGEEIAKKLDAKAALEAVQKLYPEMSIEQRQQIFKPFVFEGGHPMAVQILKLGVFDADPSVRERAWQYLREYSFVDFSEWETNNVFDWYARVGALPLASVFADSARVLVTQLESIDPVFDQNKMWKELRVLMQLELSAARKYDPTLGREFESAGLLALIQKYLQLGENEDDVRAFALRAAGWLDLDEHRLRAEVLEPMERNPAPATPAIWTEYCNLFGRRGNTWATTLLIERYRSVLASGGHGGDLFAPATALANIGDTSVIPQLIALLATDDTPDNRYAIGYFALRELSGVAWDETHGAQWWSDWWAKNYELVGARNAAKNAFERLSKHK